MLRAIITEYYAPTNTRGGRIKVSSDKEQAFIPWHHGWSVEKNHIAAARSFAQARGWAGTWYGGDLDQSTSVFVRSLDGQHDPAAGFQIFDARNPRPKA